MPVIYTRLINPKTKLIVWHCTEDADLIYSQLDLVQEDEAIYATIRNQNRKLQWLACRMALSHLMQTKAIGIRYDEHGKPFLISGEAEISFSHTGKYGAAICSTNSAVGIDLEQVREKISRVEERFLSPDELTMASGEDRMKKLTLFWAVKEALYKINGKPDLDMQHDICIESFDYLCRTDGELTARMKMLGRRIEIPVFYHMLDDAILAWATISEKI
ncbi:MAG: 4'-phosphopantetheinyl transferase superfamily protein [Bacteroidales bacterium]|nr:4'-phosphopantetheinyl transferase superfamily protein [Bacteroidales bacterium]